ncbi:hypothetical protein [Psychrobacter sp. K31L]|uniref:hypothetical protein n=1 Tax=Psychrobacter sp. K31L TaxID=2820758 RepID=UPI001B322E58|nr:hypothetical protein [Psychrobacter sp. K31L]MBP3946236.1 hypothetical protein [Psychrobacter sp. K31L]
MKNKKKHPLLSKREKAKAAKSRRRIWMAIILALLFIVIGYLVWAQSVPETSKTGSSSPSIAEQNEAAQSAAMPAENVLSEVNSEVNSDDAITSEATVLDQNATAADTADNSNSQVPKPATILSAPLPKTDSLAKEEIDRLEDERKRWAAQEKLASEQLVMNKKLTDMKEDQIALLEQQIAQLEAESTVQAKVE